MSRGCVCPLDDYDGSCMCETYDDGLPDNVNELYLRHLMQERLDLLGIDESDLVDGVYRPAESNLSLVSNHEERSDERNADCRISSVVEP